LQDGGAEHIAKTIKAIKALCPKLIIESLIPDFKGNNDSTKRVMSARPEAISHNIETVR